MKSDTDAQLEQFLGPFTSPKQIYFSPSSIGTHPMTSSLLIFFSSHYLLLVLSKRTPTFFYPKLEASIYTVLVSYCFHNKLSSQRQHKIISQFCWGEFQHRSHQGTMPKIMVSAGLHLFLEALWENPFSCSFRLLVDSVPMVVELTFPFLYWVLANAHSQLLELIHISWLMDPFIFKNNDDGQSPFQASNLSFLLLHCHITLTPLSAFLFHF